MYSYLWQFLGEGLSPFRGGPLPWSGRQCETPSLLPVNGTALGVSGEKSSAGKIHRRYCRRHLSTPLCPTHCPLAEARRAPSFSPHQRRELAYVYKYFDLWETLLIVYVMFVAYGSCVRTTSVCNLRTTGKKIACQERAICLFRGGKCAPRGLRRILRLL